LVDFLAVDGIDYLDRSDAMNDKRTMTLNLTAGEMGALDELARRKDLTKTAVIRQALRLLQTVDTRIAQGEKLFFEDELQKKKAELMVLG
jgi:hypothetical protein